MKKNKFYYYDEKNDLLEYMESDKCAVAQWINPYLTLFFPHDCTDCVAKNAIGFQIEGMKHIIHKAEEQASVPLTAEQEAQIEKMFIESGWKVVDDDNEEKKWTK